MFIQSVEKKLWTKLEFSQKSRFKHLRYRGIQKVALATTFKALAINFKRVLFKIQAKLEDYGEKLFFEEIKLIFQSIK
jgi:hypothetical protein